MRASQLIEQARIYQERRHYEDLAKAAFMAVRAGYVTKQALARDVTFCMARASKILDELIRLDICQVKYDASDKSRPDRYPINPDFVRGCHSFSGNGFVGRDSVRMQVRAHQRLTRRRA